MEVEGSRSYHKPVQLIILFKYVSAISWYNEKTIGVPFPAELRDFTLLHIVYTGFGSHVLSYLIYSKSSPPPWVKQQYREVDHSLSSSSA